MANLVGPPPLERQLGGTGGALLRGTFLEPLTGREHIPHWVTGAPAPRRGSFIETLARAIAPSAGGPRPSLGQRALRHLRFPRLRSLGWLVGACVVGHAWQSTEAVDDDPARAIHAAAQSGGLSIEDGSLAWLSARTDLGGRSRAVLVGRKNGELGDVYLAELHTSPLGQVLSCSLIDLSRTPELDETGVVATDGAAAWLIRTSAGFTGARAVRFVSAFDGEKLAEAEPADWDSVERWQNRVQNLAELGFLGLLVQDEIRFAEPARRASVSLEWGVTAATSGATSPELTIVADADSFATSLLAAKLPTEQEHRFDWIRPELGRPGNLVTWSAERLRDTWLGDRGVALLKAAGFAGIDYAELAIQAVLPSDGSEQVESDLGSLLARGNSSSRGPAGHFPPAPLEPIFAKPLDGEGQWFSLDDDAFVRKGPDGRAPFSFTFLRPDPSRPYARAYVVLWDPRRLELHLAGGTEEPRSARGEHGTGRIPRDPKVLSRLAGAFNGAFRTRHGEFGMGADGTTYLPPRPYAATVATLDDGSTVFGTWPDSPTIPSGVTSFRQNMTALIQAGEQNPYRRHYWGGVPDGWVDESFTVRTALCLTKENFVAYIYGTALDPRTLMRSAVAARCDYAIHLDMNAGHTGFEFYRAASAGHLGGLDRALDEDWEASGTVDDGSGARFDFLARRMTEHMPLMSFPRYIGREQRDFFYLTARPMVGELSLPASWTKAPSYGWQLPENGAYPPALAHASVAPLPSRPEVRVHLLTLDPHLLRPRSPESASPNAAENRSIALDVFETTSARKDVGDSLVLWWKRDAFVVAPRAADASALRVTGLRELARDSAATVAFVGTDDAGFLVYGELEAGATSLTGDEMTRVGQALGLDGLTLLGQRVAFRERNGRGEPSQAHVSLVRSEGPGARRFFEETPVVPPRIWAIRQRAPVPSMSVSSASRSVYLR